MAAFLNPGDEVTVPDPVGYTSMSQFLWGRPVSYPLREENDFQIARELNYIHSQFL